MAYRFLEDFAIGQTHETGSAVVHLDEIVDFAHRYDPQPFHLDQEAAQASIFKGMTASGWYTAALTMRLTVQSGVMKQIGIIGIGIDELRWPRPVRPGDTLRVSLEVVDVKPSERGQPRGIVSIRMTTRNQDDEIVLTEVARLIVPRRPAA
ncbi:MAG: MaoC family dehydratase [Candidatus Eremiobacteraeota bacterium]|nr:MaoC family dehydratase [Candidatus Eremiobacteraeota bacterium]MBV8365545.1 MaoC family dehydratase [Candidatus Eremiobacteraeota bacterium]